MDAEFQRYLENAVDAVAVVEADGSVSFANKRFVETFFPHQGHYAGAPFSSINASAACKDVLSAGIKAARRSGKKERFSVSDFEQGDEKHYSCRITPALNGGAVSERRLFLELRDDTERELLKKALREERAAQRQDRRKRRNFFSVLDEFPAFVYMQRQDYTVAYANKKVRAFYGETESRLCYEVFGRRNRPCPVCPTFEVFETGMPAEWEFTDDEGRTFRIYDYPFEDEEGEPLVMELGIDVTELKRVEKELFQAQKLRAIGVLAGGLAHDLNNNLLPIIFNVDHALHATQDEDAREPLDEALQAAYRAATLVEQVLDYSRQQEISRAPLHLAPIVQECVKTFQDTLRPEIRLHVSSTARQDSVCANSGQMQQVLLNLLGNAEQAIPGDGEIFLLLSEEHVATQITSPHPELPPGEYAALQVRDTGVGINKANLERVFEPFFTTKKKKGGTGMGLAVVHSVVNSCGGVVKVASESGAGTTFTLYIPKCPPPAAPVSAPAGARPRPAQGAGSRLLLVDDDHAALSAMARALRNAGYTVRTAGNGEDGLAAFSESPADYALVIADQSMPGMSGVEMSSRILALNPDARIIICTGHVEPALEKKAGEEGVSGFLMKPAAPYSLLEMVRMYCSE